MDKHSHLIAQLKDRVKDVKPLEDDVDFFRKEETLTRFLKAREWKLNDAESLLRATIDWRRENRPLQMDCRWCRERPGFHNMRQVGFDELGRPIIYACFAQAATHKNTVDDSIAHVTYLIENAKQTMKPGVTTWVFIIDCTGMTLPACNPRLGYGVTQIMSNFYPERLGLVICLNHSPVFQGVWNAIKVFLHPNTVAKMKLIRSKKKRMDVFNKYFSAEMVKWLSTEIKNNKQRPLATTQQEFWKGPISPMDHDPRGAPSYVAEYIDSFPMRMNRKGTHKPHPNIIDFYTGRLAELSRSPDVRRRAGADQRDAAMANGDESDADDDADAPELEIDEEFQIPKDAKPVYLL
ncbi:phosphatidylinositol transfer protein 3-like isoform X2 [Tubulanus polymorphus]